MTYLWCEHNVAGWIFLAGTAVIYEFRWFTIAKLLFLYDYIIAHKTKNLQNDNFQLSDRKLSENTEVK